MEQINSNSLKIMKDIDFDQNNKFNFGIFMHNIWFGKSI